MRKSILGHDENKMLDEKFNSIKSDLKLDESSLLTLLKLTKEDLELTKITPDSIEIHHKVSKDQENLNNFILAIWLALDKFKRHYMDAEAMVLALSHVYEMEDKTSKTIIELAKSDDFSVRWGTLRKIEEAVCLTFFRLFEIGDQASEHKKLNKEIAEQIFGHKVDVKYRTVFQDYGGDFDVLETQERLEIYTDGSGEDWRALKKYSEDISCAWLVVDKLSKEGCQIRLSNKAMSNEYWWCYINDHDVCVQAASAPEAICKAALEHVKKQKTN